MSVLDAARRLVALQPRHRVISVYLDLNPDRFATAPARASQIHSLIDEAGKELDSDTTLNHEERVGLREDLRRLRSYLLSREPPFKGARALAVFRAGRDGIFETVQLKRPMQARVVIEARPYVEPLIDAAEQRRWCVALVNRREGRIFGGLPDELTEEEDLEQRPLAQDPEENLRNIGGRLLRHWQRERFDRLALGGSPEVVPRLEQLLNDELRSSLVPERVDVDLSRASDDQVREALAKLVEADEQRGEREALDRVAAGVGSGGRASGGPEQTLEALNERRVQTMLLSPDFDRTGWRCPACGLLLLGDGGECPADGSELQRQEHLRESVVEAALTQDAEVIVVHHYPDLGPFEGIAALLRF